MKVALIQLNPIIGDFAANTAKMIHHAELARQQGAMLAIFPEMAVTGYPPQDLLDRSAFIRDHQQAVQTLQEKARSASLHILCGCITRNQAETGKALYNSALLIDDHSCQLVHKRLLPTYDVFDESRYFEPGPPTRPLLYNGLHLGVTICEDVFNTPGTAGSILCDGFCDPHRPRQLYPHNPLADLFDNSDESIACLINIAASPFQVGKPKVRNDYFSNICQSRQRPLLYVNQVGGQDSLIFDGHSQACDDQGNLAALARGFAEDMLIVDLDGLRSITLTTPSHRSAAPPRFSQDIDQLLEALTLGVADYVGKCGFTRVIVGLSGGIDSALTAAIAVRALGADNVLGVALPSSITSQASIDDAAELAKNLGIEFRLIPIAELFKAQLEVLKPHFAGRGQDVTEQNIQARIRGNLLMALANKYGALLLTTGNKSEMAVGYCTLYGDMSGGLAVIADVPKMKVYELCRHLNASKTIIPENIISKAPSAELAPDQKDEDDLPAYHVLDAILEMYLEKHQPLAEIIGAGFDRDTVLDVVRRVNLNEHKRKQAPMGLKVTSKAFGYGRRYPTTQRYRERIENAPE